MTQAVEALDAEALLHAIHDACSPHAVGMLCFEQDPVTARLTAGQRETLWHVAMQDAQRHAAAVAGVSGCDLGRAVAMHGIAVEHTAEDLGYGTTLVFAEYRTPPPCIVLCRASIARTKQALQAAGVHERWGGVNPEDIFIAHELYHHLDQTAGQSIADRNRVDVLRLGPWRVRSRLSVVEEVAAGAFAQALLGLPFHPRLLEWLAACHDDSVRASRLLQSLRRLSTEQPRQAPQ